MRVFFALEPDPDLKLAIQSWREKHLAYLQSHVPASNYHVTLAFLGEILPKHLETLCPEVERILESGHFKQGLVQINQMGYWAGPKILWLGPDKWPADLNTLAERLTAKGKRFATGNGKTGRSRKPDERRAYQPHITLSRQCEFMPQEPLEVNFDMHYSEFSLYESVQGKSGVRYEPLFQWSLNRFNRFL